MKSILLLSGGLDSAVCLAQSVKETEVALCLTFDYGQRAAAQEIKAARSLAAHYRLEHRVIHLPFLAEITKTSLVNREEEVPNLTRKQLDDREGTTLATAAKVWVPNRNGLFINIAAGFGESLDCGLIITGYNKEEASTFPDNSPDFVEAVNQSLSFSTQNKIKVLSYTQDLDKIEIVRLGRQLGLPFHLLWSCYHGNAEMCGTCESCQRLARALEVNGIEIPFSTK
ncbi:MAG: 7-cyano-7-deazaguanine synthase QueC [Clostridia bacterium]|nr:7-cyano-7-deazaguanine synthase QueC [Clostridia bacterium]